jgi:HEAT repeat protein
MISPKEEPMASDEPVTEYGRMAVNWPVEDIVAALANPEDPMRGTAATAVSLLITSGGLDEVTDAGAVPVLIEALTADDSRVYEEAKFSLSQYIMEERSEVLLDAGIVPRAVGMLSHEDWGVRENGAHLLRALEYGSRTALLGVCQVSRPAI